MPKAAWPEQEVRDVRCQNLIFLDLELTSGFYDFEDESDILEVGASVDRRPCA